MRSKPGFTLIEVMTIISILGVIFMIAYPRLTDVKKLSRTTSRELVTQLRNTRSKAISAGNAHYLKLLPSEPPYTEYRIFDNSDFQIGETKSIPSGVTCTATTDTYLFNYLGSCNGGNNETITLVGEGATCIVNVVGFTGRASSQ